MTYLCVDYRVYDYIVLLYICKAIKFPDLVYTSSPKSMVEMASEAVQNSPKDYCFKSAVMLSNP